MKILPSWRNALPCMGTELKNNDVVMVGRVRYVMAIAAVYRLDLFLKNARRESVAITMTTDMVRATDLK